MSTILRVRNCTKLHNLPDNLRGLRRRLIKLDLGGCNLMEGEIPSDLWCLSSLESLYVSGKPYRCIPAGITQLFKLKTLNMNHCPMLKEIGELPSSLTYMEARGCPCLETKLSQVHLVFSAQILQISNSGSSGIPEWVSHQRIGCEVRIELPMNWYEDNNFLGFVLFFHHVPLDNDECETTEVGSTSDPAIWVTYFPQIKIRGTYRSSWWNNFKARFHTPIGSGSFKCGDNACFKVKSCGIHLLYAKIRCIALSRQEEALVTEKITQPRD
ncbi:hypothetical protein CK203_113952 [Vitis vinifera]|uniref:C-JID domain-containing protein n=1 Tax=Vitis vinifera TaxID=29760 RepID=A0A438D7S1_VITVI|nr:hypothetical protein CK203_113952 [Vitis vinifera]